MAEEMTTLTSPTQAQPVTPEALSDAQLESQIKAAQEGIAKAEEAKEAAVAAQVQSALLDQQAVVPAPAQSAEQPAQPAPAEQAVPAPEVTPAQPTATGTSFADLQQKTGVKSPDMLATNFVNLQRELTRKSQELANIKRSQVQLPQQSVQPMVQQPAQEQVPLPPENQMPQINDKFLQSLATRPIETAQALVEMALAPYRQTLAELTLKEEVARLSATHPDFNVGPVNGEMQRIINERFNEGYDITKNLEDVYWMAKGRVAASQQNAVPQAQKPSPIVNGMINKAAVEGQARPQAPQTFDPKNMPLEQLEAAIINMQNQLK